MGQNRPQMVDFPLPRLMRVLFCIAGHQSSHHSGNKNCYSETSHNGLNESKSSSQRLPYFGAKDSVHAGIPYGVAQISRFPSLNPPENLDTFYTWGIIHLRNCLVAKRDNQFTKLDLYIMIYSCKV